MHRDAQLPSEATMPLGPQEPSQRRVIPALPLEIVDMIIQNVDVWQEDTLRSCSIACRAWLPSGRARLFESIRLTRPTQVRSFFDLLQSSPGLANYVREFALELESMEEYDDDNKSLGLDQEEAILTTEEYRMLRSILTKLGRMQYLELSGNLLHWPDTATFQPPQMDSVMTLATFDACFPNTECLTVLLASLPNVRHICIDGAWVQSCGFSLAEDVPYFDNPTPTLARNLHSLVLGGLHFDVPEAYRLLLSSSSQSLHVNSYSPQDLRRFCLLFRDSNMATSLSKLSLALVERDFSSPPAGPLEVLTGLEIFSRCLELRELHFGLGRGDGLFQTGKAAASAKAGGADSAIRTERCDPREEKGHGERKGVWGERRAACSSRQSVDKWIELGAPFNDRTKRGTWQRSSTRRTWSGQRGREDAERSGGVHPPLVGGEAARRWSAPMDHPPRSQASRTLPALNLGGVNADGIKEHRRGTPRRIEP
ncbi:hypothetical protein FOMPIDRAFT_1049731 [Fomitopsis schrenkii]|uniref:Uncharacterized protein n=1 Tax=Fomitopsis schrenkii TaxID=2126942 RepID=S8FQ29_FOMSC|nr:hypothetical protein FOMPIDRAFT_1049731 [Fomitopsis schrenkii]